MKKYLFTVLLILIAQIISFAQEKDPCPNIFVTEPPVAAMPGENILFSAIFPEDFNTKGLSYRWTVNNGTVVEGQGSQAITVNTSGISSVMVTAKLELTGLPKNCSSTFSGSGIVSELPVCGLKGEFGELSDRDIMARMDPPLSDLQADAKARLFLVGYGPEEKIKAREELISYWASERNADTSRIFFVRAGEEAKVRTVVLPVYEKSKEFECEDCEIITARDIKFDAEAIERELTRQNCPTISVSEPAVAVSPGEKMTFTARLSDSDIRENIGYEWTVCSGTILAGQGTPTITVRADPLSNISLIATVEITGLPDSCEDNSASGSSPTICLANPILSDEFELLSESEIRKRLEVYTKDLLDDPYAVGYIVNQVNLLML